MKKNQSTQLAEGTSMVEEEIHGPTVVYDQRREVTEPNTHKHVQFYGAFTNLNSQGHFPSRPYPVRPPDVIPAPLDDDRAHAYIDIINAIPKDKLNIIDFGGGDGTHYLTLKNNTTKKFDYHIVELPQEWRTDVSKEIKYYKSLENAAQSFPDKEEIDLVYSNGTIYITGNHVARHLHYICRIKAPRILLQRTVVAVGGNFDHFFAYDPSIGARYSIISEKGLREGLAAHGYELQGGEPLHKGVNFIHNPDPMCSCVLPSDIGTICYRDYLFIKKER